MNREEAFEIQKRIVSICKSLTERDVMLVFPKEWDPPSHGYQIHIKLDQVNDNLPIIKTVATEYHLAVDETRKGLIIILRPCFLHLSS